jgi:hypothetical protein
VLEEPGLLADVNDEKRKEAQAVELIKKSVG